MCPPAATTADPPRAADRRDSDLVRYRRTASSAGAASVAIYLWLQLDLLDGRVFGNFYDLQARAFLDGHLDVPAGSLGNEAFAVRGQEFLYNPPGPSLLRLPLFLVTDRFDGRLTALSMLVAYGLTVVLLALLVWRVRCLLAPGAALGVPESVAVGTFLVAATAGSTLLYIGAIPWVFHEAYAWAIAMSVGVAHALIGVLQRPSLRGVLATGAFTLGAVLSRTTAGFACAAAVIAAGLWLAWREQDRTWWWRVVAAGAVPVLISAALNWAKFRHPWLFPIEDQVFTGLSEERRRAIAANDGDLFGLGLIRSTVPAYLRPDGIRFSSLFPFVSLPADPPSVAGGAVFDRTYRTGSIVAFMPLLFGLSVLGATRVLRRGVGRAEVILRFALGGMSLIPAGVLFGAYIAHRYTAEFLPLLLVGGSIGIVDLGRRLSLAARDTRRAVLGLVVAVGLFGVVANLAVATTTQALANPGAPVLDHLRRQDRLSPLLGGDLDDQVSASVELPEVSAVDEVRIIGECQAVYVGTGEVYAPWVEGGTRPIELRFTRSSSVPPDPNGAIPLATFAGHRRTQLVLEQDGGRYRLVLQGGGRDEEGPWQSAPPGTDLIVSVRTDSPAEYEITIDGPDGAEGEVLRVPKEGFDANWYSRPNVLTPLPVTPQTLAAQGVLLEVQETVPPEGCPDWLARYRDAAVTGT